LMYHRAVENPVKTTPVVGQARDKPARCLREALVDASRRQGAHLRAPEESRPVYSWPLGQRLLALLSRPTPPGAFLDLSEWVTASRWAGLTHILFPQT